MITYSSVKCHEPNKKKMIIIDPDLLVHLTNYHSSKDNHNNQPWLFKGRTDAEVEAPILWPPDSKSWLAGKDPDARKDWGQEKGATEHEMVGWHHCLNGHEFEQTLGDTEGWGSLACCSQWVQKEIKTWLSYWTTTYWHITAQMFNILFFSRIHERLHKGRQRSKQICCSD